jgi:hypothetical protein
MSTNPYQPSAIVEEPFSPLASQRPAAATVFGVLNILFGVMGLCGTLASALFMVIPLSPQLTQNNPALQLMEENAFYRLFTQIGVGLNFIACIVLIVAGIGLYQLKPYGRTFSIGYSVYTIVMNLIGNVVNFVVVFPGMLAIAADAGGGPAEFAVYVGIGAGIASGFIGFIYPGLLLFFMYRPAVAAAFKQ